MDVTELNRDQLVELKQNYLCELDDSGEHEEVVGVSYGELADADEIVPDDVIFDHYSGVIFTNDDFFCSVNMS